jgi:prolyl-tRNA synthetase
MVEDALNVYVEFYQKTLGIFGYPGKKSETEKFAGADQTLTYEILAPDGKVIQGCTSHNLGQNFAKAFNIKYQSKEGKEEYVYQTSWGYSMRSMGALIMAHGDDNGLVLPPKIAPIQVVIIPISQKQNPLPEVDGLAQKVYEILEGHNLRVKIDNTDQSPGWKFNQADLEGISLRIEIGGREAQNQEVSIKLRYDKQRFVTSKLENVLDDVQKLLDEMQEILFEKSKKFTLENTRFAQTYGEFKEIMVKTRGFIEAYWCESAQCEAKIKEETKANSRCLPIGSNKEKGECIYCKNPASYRWIFGQSY